MALSRSDHWCILESTSPGLPRLGDHHIHSQSAQGLCGRVMGPFSAQKSWCMLFQLCRDYNQSWLALGVVRQRRTWAAWITEWRWKEKPSGELCRERLLCSYSAWGVICIWESLSWETSLRLARRTSVGERSPRTPVGQGKDSDLGRERRWATAYSPQGHSRIHRKLWSPEGLLQLSPVGDRGGPFCLQPTSHWLKAAPRRSCEVGEVTFSQGKPQRGLSWEPAMVNIPSSWKTKLFSPAKGSGKCISGSTARPNSVNSDVCAETKQPPQGTMLQVAELGFRLTWAWLLNFNIILNCLPI